MSAALTRADLEMFALLGVGPDLLASAQVRRVTDAEARALYGMSFEGDLAGLIYSYLDPVTENRATARLRRDNPAPIQQAKHKTSISVRMVTTGISISHPVLARCWLT